MQHLDHICRRRLPAALWCLLAALSLATTACVSTPESDERGPLVTARRILDLDFGSKAAARRDREFVHWRRFLGQEFARPAAIADTPAALGGELGRTESVGDEAVGIVGPELSRRPDDLTLVLSEVRAFGEGMAASLDVGLHLFGSSRPLGEIDDREHRTRHDDDRPEATLWQRLRRRLRL